MLELASKQNYNPTQGWVNLNLVNSEKDMMELDLSICNRQGYFLNLCLDFNKQFPEAFGGIFTGSKPPKEHENILENLKKYSQRGKTVFFSREKHSSYQYFFITYLGRNGSGRCSEYLDILLRMSNNIDIINRASIHFISSEYDIPDDLQHHIITLYLPKTIKYGSAKTEI